LISLPIPGGGCGRRYDAIEWAPGKTLASLMSELGIGDPGLAHHDPDLDEAALRRASGWRPLFGQAEKASKHLINQGVGPGDIFLFFGRFRRTQMSAHGIEFTGRSFHVIWGLLEVDEVRDPA